MNDGVSKLRIAHVVTFVSRDGAFGGPIAVASAHITELLKRGHEVHLYAGWDNSAKLEIPGAEIRLFRTLRISKGFVGLTSLGLWMDLWSKRDTFDAIHVHMGRDLITAVAGRLVVGSKSKVVLQTHGMIMPDRRLLARFIDALIVKPTFRRARLLLTLTEQETSGLSKLAGDKTPIKTIPNGIHPSSIVKDSDATDLPVLFLARLHPRKQVLVFAKAAKILHAEGLQNKFRVVGPDEGDLENLRNFIRDENLEQVLEYSGAVDQGQGAQEISRSAVYVLPSKGEVFPMTVLEALSVGTPVVLSADCGMASELMRRKAASITDGTPEDIAASIRHLLTDAELAQRQVTAGLTAVSEWLSISSVVDKIEASYK